MHGDDSADGPGTPENGVKNGGPVAPASQAEGGLSAPAVAPDSPLEARADILDAAKEYERRALLAEDRLAEVLKAYRQVKKESEGFRDRVTKNVERRFDQRRERLLLKFMEILDNLDRALEAAEQSYAGGPLIEGLILVRTQLLQTLQEEGLERIPVLGLPYDPTFSEAVASTRVADQEHHNVVVKELLRGYRLHGRIARASRVVIGDYRGPEEEAAEPPAPEGMIGADELKPPAPPAQPPPTIEEIIDQAEEEDAEAAAEEEPESILREARKALKPLYRDEPED